MTSDPRHGRKTPMQEMTSVHDARSGEWLFAVTPIATISVLSMDGDVIVSATGELDLSNAEPFGAVLKCVRDHHTGRIVVDLTNTQFLDVSIVGVLEHHRREATAGLVVSNARRIVKRLLTLASFDPQS